jgi:hypothetical protein
MTLIFNDLPMITSKKQSPFNPFKNLISVGLAINICFVFCMANMFRYFSLVLYFNLAPIDDIPFSVDITIVKKIKKIIIPPIRNVYHGI